MNEEIISYRENLKYSAKDDELLLAINKSIQESQTLKEKMDGIGRKNKKFWALGSDEDLSKIHKKKAKVITNRIFTDVETSVPILTAEPPEPEIIGELNNDIAERMKKGLQFAYEVKYKMQQVLQKLTRHWYLFRIGVLKYRWDGKFITENVLPRKIGIDPKATSLDNCEFIWEELEDKVENVIDKFPDKAKQIKDKIGKGNEKSKIKYTEFWGGNGEWTCWKFQDIILDKSKNPNFNYDGENIFESPRFPYIFLNVFTFGDETSLYDETSLIEESIPLQLGVNMLERQILDLNEGRKRVWTVSGDAMSENKFQDLINKTGDFGVYFDRKAPTSSLSQVQSGIPDAGMFNNLTHLLGEIDNIMGIHSTTRGERAQQETATGRQLLMGSDYGRQDLVVRNIEQVMEEWYNSYLQMIKVYEPVEVLIKGEEKIELTADMIPSNIQIMIKKGSTLPVDKRSRMENAINLAQMDKIDPKTLFEEMGYSNIEQRVMALYQWLQATGKIQMPQQVQGGQGGEAAQSEQLARLQQTLQSPEFQQLPPEEQMQFIKRGREVIQQLK